MDTILPNLQEAALSMGPVSRPSGKFQSWPRSRHSIEETLPERGALFSCEYSDKKQKHKTKKYRPKNAKFMNNICIFTVNCSIWCAMSCGHMCPNTKDKSPAMMVNVSNLLLAKMLCYSISNSNIDFLFLSILSFASIFTIARLIKWFQRAMRDGLQNRCTHLFGRRIVEGQGEAEIA